MLKRLIAIVFPAAHSRSEYEEIEKAILTLASWLEQRPWARNISILLGVLFGWPLLLLIPLWHSPPDNAIMLAQLIVSMITGIVQAIALLATVIVGLYVAGQYKEAYRKRIEDGTARLELTIPEDQGISGADSLLLTVRVHLSNKGIGTAQNVQLSAYIDSTRSLVQQIGSVRNDFDKLLYFEFESKDKIISKMREKAKNTPTIALSMLENYFKNDGPIPKVKIECTYDHAHMDSAIGRAVVSVTYNEASDRLWQESPFVKEK